MGIHFLRCSHGGEHITFYDVVQDALFPLLEMLGFTFFMNRQMFFQCLCFQSLQWCIDILLSINGVHILFYVIIVNYTQVDLVSRVAMSWGIVAIIATQAKDEHYCD
jgi:hypothetical protein